MIWKVVPISKYQQLDVHPNDLLDNGDFRKCDTYRGGGGYDQFPLIAERRLNVLASDAHQHFVVQLYGCNLDCPYCYVTRSGVWGVWKPYTTEQLVGSFLRSNQQVFHLMGGAPAVYLNQWPSLLDELEYKCPQAIFHSDFLLTERVYDPRVLMEIKRKRSLYAVNIKGVTAEDYKKNTRKDFKPALFWSNFDKLVDLDIPFYITFTNPDPSNYFIFLSALESRYGRNVLRDAFTIALVSYKAQPFVDILPTRTEYGSPTNTRPKEINQESES